MAKIKEYLGLIITIAAVIGVVAGGLAYFAKAEDLQLVQQRLDQKIVADQAYDTQKRVWALEERNREFGTDCSRWPDARDREQYRELKVKLEELDKQQYKMIRK
jgi:hypothetical protein